MNKRVFELKTNIYKVRLNEWKKKRIWHIIIIATDYADAWQYIKNRYGIKDGQTTAENIEQVTNIYEISQKARTELKRWLQE